MIEKLKNFFAYATLTALVIILTSCAASSLPVNVGYEDDNVKGTYSSKGGLDLVVKGYDEGGVSVFYSENGEVEVLIDKTSNK